MLVRQLMAENEEQGREIRRLERRVGELDIGREGLEEEDDENDSITDIKADNLKFNRSTDIIEKDADV